MVNQDFDKFIKVQEKHKSTYLGGETKGKYDKTASQGTDVSPGAEGRDINKLNNAKK